MRANRSIDTDAQLKAAASRRMLVAGHFRRWTADLGHQMIPPMKVLANAMILGSAVFAACVGYAVLASSLILLSALGGGRPSLSFDILSLLINVPQEVFSLPRKLTLFAVFISALFWGGLAAVISLAVQLIPQKRTWQAQYTYRDSQSTRASSCGLTGRSTRTRPAGACRSTPTLRL